MLFVVILVAVLIQDGLTIPPPLFRSSSGINGTSELNRLPAAIPTTPFSSRDHEFLATLHSTRASLGSNFKFKYVGEHGVISSSRHSSGHWFEIAATRAVSETAHAKAAEIVSKMTRYMPADIFANLATHATAGIFTKEEHLSVYPEYKSIADTPQCHGTCAGSCEKTCTFDGRKYETLAGVGGRRAVILDDNILCDREDPYRHTDNILVHEFTHTIHLYALPSSWKSQISSAYQHAKSHRTWDLHSYAMSNDQEYFAEASGSFFNAEHMSSSAGGMNYHDRGGDNLLHWCSGHHRKGWKDWFYFPCICTTGEEEDLCQEFKTVEKTIGLFSKAWVTVGCMEELPVAQAGYAQVNTR